MRRLHEHAVVLAAHLVQRVADHCQKVLVCSKNAPVQLKLDHGLRLAYGRELAFVVRGGQLLRGDVAGVFDNFERAAIPVQYGIIARLQPDFAAAFGNAAELAADVLATAQRVPELLIFGPGAKHGINEYRVRLAAHLVQRVADCGEEVLIRREYFSVKRELDDRL